MSSDAPLLSEETTRLGSFRGGLSAAKSDAEQNEIGDPEKRGGEHASVNLVIRNPRAVKVDCEIQVSHGWTLVIPDRS
jgi:hypothetical protein